MKTLLESKMEAAEKVFRASLASEDAVRDALGVYRKLLENFDPEKVGIPHESIRKD